MCRKARGQRGPEGATREARINQPGSMANDWTPPTPPGWEYRPPENTPNTIPAAPPVASRMEPVKVAAVGDLGPAKVQLLISRVIQPALREQLPWTRNLLSEILRGAPGGTNGHDKRGLALRVFEFVRYRLRYINDPTGREMFTALPVLWSRGMGDCDDFSAILAALLMAAGINVKLRVIRTPKAYGWSHIYPMAWLPGRGNTPPDWRALDATVAAPAGWEAERAQLFDTEVKP